MGPAVHWSARHASWDGRFRTLRHVAAHRGDHARGRLLRLCLRTVIPAHWDAALRATGAVASAAIALMLLVPALTDWAAFFSVVMVASGPTSTVMPVASEPFLLAFGQLHAPLLVALVGTAAIVLIEMVNYPLFHTALHADVLRRFRQARVAKTIIRWFGVAPAFIVFLAALSPVPFALARALAALSHYSFLRYLIAMALGRIPRLWMIAFVGSVLPISPGFILAVGGGVAVVLCVTICVERHRHPSLLRSVGA